MLKRLFDIAVTGTALIVVVPLLLVIGLLIKLQSPGPVFYCGERVGLHGRKFRIFKLRTMVNNAEDLGGPSTAFNDRRLTKLGRFLRKYKIDELPQLINILRGEMSVVGPRPQVEAYTRLYNPTEKIILSVRPGLTDYASIRFIHLDKLLGDDCVDEKYRKEVEPVKNHLRVKYAQEHSFWVDLKIIFMTFLRLCRINSIWNTKD